MSIGAEPESALDSIKIGPLGKKKKKAKGKGKMRPTGEVEEVEEGSESTPLMRKKNGDDKPAKNNSDDEEESDEANPLAALEEYGKADPHILKVYELVCKWRV